MMRKKIIIFFIGILMLVSIHCEDGPELTSSEKEEDLEDNLDLENEDEMGNEETDKMDDEDIADMQDPRAIIRRVRIRLRRVVPRIRRIIPRIRRIVPRIRRIRIRIRRITPPDLFKCPIKTWINAYQPGGTVGGSTVPSRLLSITEDPDEGFYIRHTSGKCVVADLDNDGLLLRSRCQDKFEWHGKKIKHIASGLCIYLSAHAHKYLKLGDCAGAVNFKYTSHYNLQALNHHNYCIHPVGGKLYPSDGTKILLHPVCNQHRLVFRLDREPNDISARKERIIVVKQGQDCMSLDRHHKIKFTRACSEFVLDRDKNLKHLDSGRCIAPDKNRYLTAYTICNSLTKFKLTASGTLIHTQSGKYVYRSGTSAILSSSSKSRFSVVTKRHVFVHWLYRMKHISTGKCISIDKNNKLTLSTSCNTMFLQQKSTALLNFPSMKCVQPDCDGQGCRVSVANYCNRRSWFEQPDKHLYVRHRWSGQCLMQYNGNNVILHTSCSNSNARFYFETAGYSEDVGRSLISNTYEIRHYKGKCVTGTRYNQLMLSNSCNDVFQFDKNNHLVHLQTGKALGDCSWNSCAPTLVSNPKHQAKYKYLKDTGELRQIGSNIRCLLPYGNSPDPKRDTRLVLHTSCGRRSYTNSLYKLNRKEVIKKFVIYQKTSGLCFAVNKNNMLYLTKHCSTNFALTQSGAFVHVDSGRCVTPACTHLGCKLYLKHQCNSNTHFKFLPNGMLKSLATNTCIHPMGGQPHPKDGNPIVIHLCGYKPSIHFVKRYDGYIESLLFRQALAWAPRLYFERSETYYPSSIDYFLDYVYLKHNSKRIDNLTPSNLPGAPYTSNMETKQRLDTPSRILPFFHGQNPRSHTFPIYAIIRRVNRLTELKYYVFYPYNKGKNICIPTLSIPMCKCTYFGNHVGDWENVKFLLKDGKPWKIEISSHNFEFKFIWRNDRFIQTGGRKVGDLQITKEGRVAIFAAVDSHGQYPKAQQYKYHKSLPLYDQSSSDGISLLTSNNLKMVFSRDRVYQNHVGTESWKNFGGRWGNIPGKFGILPGFDTNCIPGLGSDGCRLVSGPVGPPQYHGNL